MSWVTVIWSMVAGACVALGAAHLLVWCWNRALRATHGFRVEAGNELQKNIV